MKKRILVVIGILLLHYAGVTQIIHVGDKIPDREFEQLLNYDKPTLRLSNFKGKKIILDFWGTGCVGCIKAFPKIEDLQQAFGDRLQIIYVNKQSKDSTLRFFARRKQIKMPTLPMITDDSILKRHFPSAGLPHHVWIDENGIVEGTGEYPNMEKIRRWLRRDENLVLNETNANYVRTKVNPDIPIVASIDNNNWANTEYWSLLMPAIDEQLSENKIEKLNGSSKYNRIRTNRSPGAVLYRMAWMERLVNTKTISQVLFATKDTTRFYDKEYAYDLLIPAGQADQLYEYMKSDLRRLFKADARIEKRMATCYVLLRSSEEDKLKSKGGAFFISTHRYSEDSVYSIQNGSFLYLTNVLKMRLEKGFNSTPFIDASGYSGNIDITINADVMDRVLPLDMALLRKELQRYGLDIEIKEWPVDTLVVFDLE